MPLEKITRHLIRPDDGLFVEADFLKLPRQGKEPAHVKVEGTERECFCLNKAEIEAKIKAQTKAELTSV